MQLMNRSALCEIACKRPSQAWPVWHAGRRRRRLPHHHEGTGLGALASMLPGAGSSAAHQCRSRHHGKNCWHCLTHVQRPRQLESNFLAPAISPAVQPAWLSHKRRAGLALVGAAPTDQCTATRSKLHTGQLQQKAILLRAGSPACPTAPAAAPRHPLPTQSTKPLPGLPLFCCTLGPTHITAVTLQLEARGRLASEGAKHFETTCSHG